MLMSEAMRVINSDPRPTGYMVSFERKEGRFLLSDYFPARGEPPIPTEKEAWGLAQKFAAKTVGECVNVYVMTQDFVPVPGYEARQIENRT